jgi:hypothetical protein
MKMLSLILALAFAVALPSLAGRPDGRLPGVGTFSYNAAPGGSDTPQRIAALSRQQAGVNN